MKVIVKDEDGNIITDEKLKNFVLNIYEENKEKDQGVLTGYGLLNQFGKNLTKFGSDKIIGNDEVLQIFPSVVYYVFCCRLCR